MSAPDLTTKFTMDGNIDAAAGTYTLFDLEKRVIESLNRFNEKYAIYLRCSEGIYTPNDVNYNIMYDGKRGCNGENKDKVKNEAAAKNAYNAMKTRIDALDKAIASIKTTSGGITPEEYDAKYSTLLTKHAEILRVRQDIDNKMKDIEAVDNPEKRFENPRVQDIFSFHDSTMYSTMMMTVLATSLLYYAFMKVN